MVLTADTERRIFFEEALQSNPHLVQVGLGPWTHCDRENWLRELDTSECEWTVRIGQGITCPSNLEFRDSPDVPRAELTDWRLFLAADDEELPDALGLAALRDSGVRIGAQGAGVDAEVGQFPDEGVGNSLEDDSCERAVRIGSEFHL
ncbi:hypothetical protein HRbin27_00897 [bacterium HR27]|nr:hypothetical protein HRbin27_00897 [bacterium HR27]